MPFHRFHFFQGGSERGGFWHLQTVLADGETGLLANSNATSPPLYQAPPHPGSGDGSGEEGNVIIGSPMQLGRSPNTACLEPRLPNPNTPPSDPALSSQRPRTKQNTMASTSSDQPPSDSSSDAGRIVCTPSSTDSSSDFSSTSSHAPTAYSSSRTPSTASDKPPTPSYQLERCLAQSPFDDGSLHGRFADAHDRVAVHEARAQEATDAFDRRWPAAL